MTAIGFLLWILPVAILRQEDELFWNTYTKTYRLLNILAAVGFLLFCAGISVVFWRVLP